MSLINRTDPKAERIHSLPFFKQADRQAVNHLASAADEVDVSAGQTLIIEGRHHHEAYVVEKGVAEVVVDGEVVADIPAGEMIGELGVFCDGPASATVRAKTDMTVLVIPYNQMDRILDENPAMVKGIAKELAERLRSMDKSLHHRPVVTGLAVVTEIVFVD